MVHTEGGSLAEYLEVAAGPQQQKRPLPRAPCVAVGKMQGGINVERAQEVIRSNLKLAPSFPQQLFAGSSAIVFYSLLTSAQKYYPHLPAAVTSDLVTGQCSNSTKLPLWPSFASLRLHSNVILVKLHSFFPPPNKIFVRLER